MTVGARILGGSDSPLLRLAGEIALRHHERWDGGGYPDGPAGEEILVAARIVAVADAFDTLLCARSYKPAWPLEWAVAEVAAGAGTQFCPATAEAFARLAHAELAPGADYAVRPRVAGCCASGTQSAHNRDRRA